MKYKYNKEYEHLQFDETIEQKEGEEKKPKEIEELENLKSKNFFQ